MDDPTVTKNLRAKEKVQFMLDGTIDASQASSGKRNDTPCLIMLVTS